jgi:hypothetical protein
MGNTNCSECNDCMNNDKRLEFDDNLEKPIRSRFYAASFASTNFVPSPNPYSIKQMEKNESVSSGIGGHWRETGSMIRRETPELTHIKLKKENSMRKENGRAISAYSQILTSSHNVSPRVGGQRLESSFAHESSRSTFHMG